jgi:DNA repair protein RadC
MTRYEPTSTDTPAVFPTLPEVCPTCSGEVARLHRPGAPSSRPEVSSPDAAAAILTPLLAHLDREHCLALMLDTKHRLLATTTVSIGSIDRTFMSPRELYRDALAHNAAAVLVAHNHPSGDPEPSTDDERITRRLVSAGELLSIELLDHLVIGADQWVSLARRGLL